MRFEVYYKVRYRQKLRKLNFLRKNIKTLKSIILIATVILLSILLVYTQPQKDLVPLLQETYEDVQEPVGPSENQEVVDSLKDTTVKDVKQTVMRQPNYLGEDVNKKLWSLKASKAVQHGEVSDGFTDLFDVVANTLSKKDKKVDYIAEKGKFLSKENKIVLQEDVIIKSKTLQLKTDNLEYSLDNAYAKSPTPVDIKLEMGHIVADSMESFDNAEKLVLTGNVRAKLYNVNRKKD